MMQMIIQIFSILFKLNKSEKTIKLFHWPENNAQKTKMKYRLITNKNDIIKEIKETNEEHYWKKSL